jgi:hypothetical protein
MNVLVGAGRARGRGRAWARVGARGRAWALVRERVENRGRFRDEGWA